MKFARWDPPAPPVNHSWPPGATDLSKNLFSLLGADQVSPTLGLVSPGQGGAVISNQDLLTGGGGAAAVIKTLESRIYAG